MYSRVKDSILKSKKIAIFNHSHPDGDAMGSAYALKLALISIGKEAEVFLRDGDYSAVEYSYIIPGKTVSFKAEECDLSIIVDSSDIGRVEDIKDKFSKKTIAIDHHVTHIPFTKLYIVDSDSPAAGQVVFKLLKYMNIPISKEIAHNLYVSISSDTGSFKYSSTTSETHIIVSELINCGIDIGEISKKMFDTYSLSYVKMLSFALEKTELYADGKIAILSLDKSDFEKINIKENEASGIVTFPGKIEGVEVSSYIRSRDDEVKVSLRSNTSFDVSKIALSFGGGGHVKAAGFFFKGISVEEAKSKVLDVLIKNL